MEGIRRFTEADTISYLPLSALSEAVEDDKQEYCYACYTGNYPTHLINIDELLNTKSRC